MAKVVLFYLSEFFKFDEYWNREYDKDRLKYIGTIELPDIPSIGNSVVVGNQKYIVRDVTYFKDIVCLFSSHKNTIDVNYLRSKIKEEDNDG